MPEASILILEDLISHTNPPIPQPHQRAHELRLWNCQIIHQTKNTIIW